MESVSTSVSSQPTNTAPVDSGNASQNGAPAQSAEQRAAALRKLQVDGRELEVPDEEFTKYAQKGYAADKRFQEAAKLRKEAEERHRSADEKLTKAEQRAKKYEENFLTAAIEDAEQSGDPNRIQQVRLRVEQYLAQELRKEQMSPEQRQLMQEQQARQQAEQRLKQIEDANKSAEHKALELKHQKDYEQKFTKALQTGKVPPTERAIMQMIEMQRMANSRGYELTPERMAEDIRSSYIDDNKALVDAFKKQAQEAESKNDSQALIQIGDQIREFFGEDIVNLIRRSDLARLRGGQPNVPKPVLETPRTQNSGEQQKSKPMTEDEYRDWRRENARRADQGLPLLP